MSNAFRIIVPKIWDGSNELDIVDDLQHRIHNLVEYEDTERGVMFWLESEKPELHSFYSERLPEFYDYTQGHLPELTSEILKTGATLPRKNLESLVSPSTEFPKFKMNQKTNIMTVRNANDFSHSFYDEYLSRYGASPVESFRFDFSTNHDKNEVADWVRDNIDSLLNVYEHEIITIERLWYAQKAGMQMQVCNYVYFKYMPFAYVKLYAEDTADYRFTFMVGADTQHSAESIALKNQLAAAFRVAGTTLKQNTREDNDRRFGIISKTSNGFNLSHFMVKAHDDEMLENYNDDFAEVHERIITTFNTMDKNGIVLLHGEPGTGKTSYLRYLISKLKKQPIYLPPDLAPCISSPEFVSFLAEQSNSVLIIEDAENILKTREAGGNQAVSNILNVSDGILGDALNLQIICSFNTQRDEIDPALLRPGRLIVDYKFDKLTEEKTRALVKKYHGEEAEPTATQMTIAEIYNMAEMPIIKKKEEVRFGFS